MAVPRNQTNWMDGLLAHCKGATKYLSYGGYSYLSSSVVCPVSLVSQWASEISRMAVGLRVIEHHGQNRTTDPSALQQAHVVVTTYAIVASEYASFAPEAKNEGKSKKSKSKLMTAASDSDSDSSEGFTRKLARKTKAGKTKDALFRVKWFRIVLGG